VLKTELQKHHNVHYVHHKSGIKKGDVCFILSCSRIIEDAYLNLNKNNIVVHASDLPEGIGFSPLQWQILEGENNITITLLEAVVKVDEGPYYLKTTLAFNGTELLVELRDILGKKIIAMCLEYIEKRDSLKPIPQQGEQSFYARRTSRDDELDINLTIKQQFNHFRIADNERFPLYFRYLDNKYILKIFKE
jgi:methionyl-tRNA formyltransferase